MLHSPSGRPLDRQLIRLGARLVAPALSHRADLWPGLEIDQRSGAVRWRGGDLLRLEPPSTLVARGLDRIAVVGAGPSLGSQRPERLAPGTAILLNGAACLADRLRPMAVVVEDERFVARHAAMLLALPRELPLLLSAGAIRALAERSPAILRDRPVALLDNLRRPVAGRRRGLDDPRLDAVLERGPGGAALSRNPDVGIVVAGTVAFSALQVALAARPGSILLAGIDLGNADAEPRFYEAPGRVAPSGLVRALPRILAAFALARGVAARDGVAMGCASPVSSLLPLGYPRDPSLD